MNLLELSSRTEILLLFFLVILPLVLWVVVLIDCLKGDFEKNGKLIWILVIVLLPILGSILYATIGRNQKLISKFS